MERCKHCGQSIRTDIITDFSHAFNYAKNLLRKFNKKIIEINDLMSEGWTIDGFSRKKMKNFILNEHRRNKVEKFDVKVCSNCNEPKTSQEFYLRVDYRTNFQYHIQPCKECFKNIYQQKIKAKKKFEAIH